MITDSVRKPDPQPKRVQRKRYYRNDPSTAVYPCITSAEVTSIANLSAIRCQVITKTITAEITAATTSTLQTLSGCNLCSSLPTDSVLRSQMTADSLLPSAERGNVKVKTP